MPQVSSRSSTTIKQLTPAGVGADTLRRWTLHARRRLHLAGRIEITIVPPAISREWNRRYRRRSSPTNVLSFDYAHSGSNTRHSIDGEVLLCPTVIRREARELKQTYRTRLKMLLEHGLIHLLGFDHRTSAEQVRWDKQEQLLV